MGEEHGNVIPSQEEKAVPRNQPQDDPGVGIKFLKNKFIYLFIYGCIGSLLLCTGFL